jgi:hypothetical protein
LKTPESAISPTGLPSASLKLKPKSMAGFGVPSGSDTAKKSWSALRMAARTTALFAPWRRKTVAATSTAT